MHVSTNSMVTMHLESYVYIYTGTSCELKQCGHPRGVNWVCCDQCDSWYHCICVNVSHSKAKLINFTFICK